MWVNEAKTLWLSRNKDTWQLPVIDVTGSYCGHVIAQIVDPKQCLVRYFVIFFPNQERTFLLPSEAVIKIDTNLYCLCRLHHCELLPDFIQNQKITTEVEQIIQIALQEWV